jgi:hypothetical protein
MDVLFTVNINLNASGVITLNALANGYESPPVTGSGNPPYVLGTLMGPTNGNIKVIEQCGQCMSGPYGQYSYANNIIYNLPDGSYVTISFTVDFHTNVTAHNAIVSPNSGFEVVDDALTGTADAGYVYNFTLQPLNTTTA